MIRINADLFRAAYVCVSTEETRYYLNGVYVEPHADEGVILVATDGHRLVCIHDATGTASGAAIIRVDKNVLKKCRKGRRENRREIQVNLEAERADVLAFEYAPDWRDHHGSPETGRPVAVQAGCVIDGTFPDYRRVIPSTSGTERHADTFNGRYLAAFADIGDILREHKTGSSCRGGTAMIVHSHDIGAPALIRWDSVEHAFGVLMPVRSGGTAAQGTVPAWFSLPQLAEAAE